MELRQTKNTVLMVGTIKDIDLNIKKSKKGNDYIKGIVEVTVKDGDKINSIKVSVMCMSTWKQYQGLLTVKNEYRVGDRVQIKGQIALNEYCGKNGIVSYNTIESSSFTRNFQDNGTDKARATLEVVIDDIEDEIVDDLPTGNKNIKCFGINYFGEVVELKKVVLPSKIAKGFTNLYFQGSTGTLTLKINNYVESTERAPINHGFGEDDYVESEVNNYTDNLEIVGGSTPYGVDEAFSPEEIEEAHKKRNLAIASLEKDDSMEEFNGFGETTETTEQQTNNMDDIPF